MNLFLGAVPNVQGTIVLRGVFPASIEEESCHSVCSRPSCSHLLRCLAKSRCRKCASRPKSCQNPHGKKMSFCLPTMTAMIK
jgi:hypothetical protein